ncbi:MAG TPA: M28 family peptidase, partial [Chloroflexota bacterium]
MLDGEATMTLDAIRRDLSVDEAWRHLERIAEEIPSRLAGSPNARRMAEYAHDALGRAGLASRMQEFPGLVSFPETALIRVLAPERREIAANTLGHSASTDGLEGELVYVGSGAESEYAGKEVRGKITLSELSYSPARHEKALIAWRQGSIAQVMMNWGDESNQAVPFGSIKSAWGNPTPEALASEMPDLPCVGIARTEGLRLKQRCLEGPVRIWLRARASNGWHPLTMTSAELTAGAGQFMLLGGHMDSWPGPQASDNAAGSACILELARVFARQRGELRRGLVVGLWMGHETGTMVSSSRFADVNWDRLRRGCVAYLQIDQPAIAGSSTWRLDSTDEAASYLARATREVVGDAPIYTARMRRTGDTSFFGVGLPTIAGIMSFSDAEIERTALATLGWWHHSLENTLDKVDKGRLALHLQVYARWMWDLLTAPLLPFEYAPMAERLASRVGELAGREVPEIELASVAERARELRELAAHLDGRVEAERARLAGGAGEQVAELLNGAMLQLSRALVPIASTVVGPYGQDRYGHAWQSSAIPA